MQEPRRLGYQGDMYIYIYTDLYIHAYVDNRIYGFENVTFEYLEPLG